MQYGTSSQVQTISKCAWAAFLTPPPVKVNVWDGITLTHHFTIPNLDSEYIKLLSGLKLTQAKQAFGHISVAFAEIYKAQLPQVVKKINK